LKKIKKTKQKKGTALVSCRKGSCSGTIHKKGAANPYSLLFRSITSIRPQGEDKTPHLTALDTLITLEGREGRKLWDSNKPDPYFFKIFSVSS
jgi:hypothetical protein